MEPTDFIEPTTKSRLKVALFVALCLVFVAATHVFWPRFMQHIQALPLCDQLPWLQAILIAFYLFSPFTAIVLIRHARKIFSSNQVPPPGTLVFFRTPIRRGRTAALHAYASIAVAVSAIAIPLFFVAKAWPTVSPIFISVAQCRAGGT